MTKSRPPTSIDSSTLAPEANPPTTAHWSAIVTEPCSGRPEKWILSALERDPPPRELSRSQLERLISEGAVRLNGVVSLKIKDLKVGDRIEIFFPELRSLTLTPTPMDLEVLFEDDDLIVINKPQGLTVHPSDTQQEHTLVHGLLARAQHQNHELSGIGGVLRPGIVHRLDKDTSGVMVVAKSDRAHTGLSDLFAKHEIERRYWALVYGVPAFGATGTRIETRLGRHPVDRKRMAVLSNTGRTAITDARVLEAFGKSGALVEATLATGRTHQVRVHLAHLGHSLIGDPTYGIPSSRDMKWTRFPSEVREQIQALSGQALHARVLGFVHPVTGESLRFESEPPQNFTQLLKLLRGLE